MDSGIQKRLLRLKTWFDLLEIHKFLLSQTPQA